MDITILATNIFIPSIILSSMITHRVYKIKFTATIKKKKKNRTKRTLPEYIPSKLFLYRLLLEVCELFPHKIKDLQWQRLYKKKMSINIVYME